MPSTADRTHDRDDRDEHAAADDTAGGRTLVEITVVRSGGFAGLVRIWRVRAPADAEPRWIALIDACDWDGGGDAPGRGADRYQWDIEASAPPARHRAQVPDDALRGPWRELVDAVRAADAAAEAPGTPPAETRGARRDPRS